MSTKTQAPDPKDMAAGAGTAAQAHAQTAPLDLADAGVLTTIEAYEKAWAAKDVEGVLACCTPNVTWCE